MVVGCVITKNLQINMAKLPLISFTEIGKSDRILIVVFCDAKERVYKIYKYVGGFYEH